MIQKTLVLTFLLGAGLLTACHGAATPAPSDNVTLTLAPPLTSTLMPAVVMATETSRPLPMELVWEITGNPNPFDVPIGIAADPRGYVYVMDTRNSRIQKFDTDGNFILMWGSPGSAEGQFSIRVPDQGRLAVDTQGNVYVLDVSNFRVQKFDGTGKFLTQWGSRGNGDGQFLEATDIAIDKQGNVHVVDGLNNTVQKFDQNGKLLLRWGKPGFEDGEFALPISIAIDPEGNILIADMRGRIQKFDIDGNFLSRIPMTKADNQPIDTWNIAVDGQGNIYIADYQGKRIVKLNRNGGLMSTLKDEEVGAGLNNLQDIAVDEQGNVYVSSGFGNRVQKFRQSELYP